MMDKVEQEKPVVYSPREFKEKAINILNSRDFVYRTECVAGRFVRRRKDEGASVYYDSLEGDGSSLTVVFSEKNNTLPLRESLADNQPVTLIGRPRLAEFNDQITLNFYVDEVGDGSSVSMIGREEYRCVELLRLKMRQGKRPLPNFRQIVAEGRKPSVCLVLPKDSQAEGDIDSKLKGHEDRININRQYVSFGKAEEVADAVRNADTQGYDLIAISRGGGDIKSLEKLDKPVLLEALLQINTPYIAAIGHTADMLYVKDIADYTCDVPNDLGAWLVKRFDESNDNVNKGNLSIVEQQYQELKQEFNKIKKNNDDIKHDNILLDIELRRKVEENKQLTQTCNQLRSQIINSTPQGKSLLEGLPFLQTCPNAVQWGIIILAAIGLLNILF